MHAPLTVLRAQDINSLGYIRVDGDTSSANVVPGDPLLLLLLLLLMHQLPP
jgi:hypothetical protein